MGRISTKQLKDNGFVRVDNMHAYQRGGIIVSYGLIVAIDDVTCEGYHDYSTSTAGQVTRATGVRTADRRKWWTFVDEKEFLRMSQEIIDSLH